MHMEIDIPNMVGEAIMYIGFVVVVLIVLKQLYRLCCYSSNCLLSMAIQQQSPYWVRLFDISSSIWLY